MKRVLLALLGICAVAGFCMAQAGGSFRQEGMASQEMQREGMFASHASINLGTRAWITNVATGEYVEVIVAGRILPEGEGGRVVDISPAAALALGLPDGGAVRVTVSERPPPVSVPPVFIAAEQEEYPEAVLAAYYPEGLEAFAAHTARLSARATELSAQAEELSAQTEGLAEQDVELPYLAAGLSAQAAELSAQAAELYQRRAELLALAAFFTALAANPYEYERGER